MTVRDHMIAAANEWGGQMDPCRRWFIAGWSDEEAGDRDNKPSGTLETHAAEWCAYNSGVVAYRSWLKC